MTAGSARAPAGNPLQARPRRRRRRRRRWWSYVPCEWTGGAVVGLHTNPLDIPQPSQCDTALPIQHVQPSTCADTINQIN
ncbi:hypothetical protein ALC56_02647 [Trachymyrmex septentrionalis]|uniref:Uncharacterized protein n=1 Tax=Trachymyrmex septentrionalis TaxID=34720 RepID=A0A195FQJ0_9HYME|nr:hypothetical protein ALC56_02647 [Trachymyrmex septentrionalis]